MDRDRELCTKAVIRYNHYRGEGQDVGFQTIPSITPVVGATAWLRGVGFSSPSPLSLITPMMRVGTLLSVSFVR